MHQSRVPCTSDFYTLLRNSNLDDLIVYDSWAKDQVDEKIYPGNYYLFESAFGVVSAYYSNKGLYKVKMLESACGVKPVGFLQKSALMSFFNEQTPLNICTGRAGCGKTFLALAFAIYALKQGLYKNIVVSKPLVSVSRSKFLGTMPGELGQKIAPFLDSFYDVALSLNIPEYELSAMIEDKEIEFVPLDFVRGRDLSNTLVILDEVQNTNSHDLLALSTRIGKGSKLILLGDDNPQQKDIRDESALGKVLDSEYFWNSSLTSHVELEKRFRSPIVELMEKVLE